MLVKPPISELDFIKKIRNYKEFSSKVNELGAPDASQLITNQATYIATKWARLGLIHLKEAKKARAVRSIRACYSRAYYAGYSFSKAIRYLENGNVSLTGDDHQKASDLPGDFPDRDRTSKLITDLYQCRLRADYDNWGAAGSGYVLTLGLAIAGADKIMLLAKKYLSTKYGIRI